MATEIFRVTDLMHDASVKLEHNPSSMTSYDVTVDPGWIVNRFDSLVDASSFTARAVDTLGGNGYAALCAIADYFDQPDRIYVIREDGEYWLVNEHEWDED